MCIIMVKIVGSDFPSQDIVSTMMENNPDGFSMAWNGPDGRLHNFKTMDPTAALKKYIKLSSTLDPATTGFLFHARIATHGSKKVENCHCWIKRGIAFAHNGILTNIPARGDMTDSETFFEDYFLKVASGCEMSTAFAVAKALAGSSKFAFLGKKGNFKLIGDYNKYGEMDKKGVCYYSNYSYRPRRDVFARPQHGRQNTVLYGMDDGPLMRIPLSSIYNDEK